MKKFSTAAACAAFLSVGVSAGAIHAQTAEVLHWWTSGSEQAALAEVRKAFEAKGGTWVDTPIAGGSNARAAAVNRMLGGDPAAVFQFSIGQQLRELADQGLLANVGKIAEEENWDEKLPPLIVKAAKYDGDYIAAPINIHGENWMFYNKAVLDDAGIDVPTSWDDFIAAAEKLKAAGVTPIGLGGQPWQERIMFNSVLLGVGGREFYADLYSTLDDDLLESDTMHQVFETFAALKPFVDESSPGRNWNEATNMVIKGDAAFQFMGDWAKGEIIAAGIEPGTTVGCAFAPAVDTAYIMTVDAFAFSAMDGEDATPAQEKMAKVMLEPDVQIAFNMKKGSIPARLDVPSDSFDACAQKAIKTLQDKKTHLVSTGLFGVPSAVSGAIDDSISNFWNSADMSPKEGQEQFHEAISYAK
ncbi:ABC transporter substrate-binding protein [Thalassospira sp. GB04J01]|uniref:ABC transporter substrate-binding protein n=1 Tax=Thalassospira sp. GB04J01 TaxID=1485225 RepID=UPI000C9ADB4D|nr:ABC transporter substrate-binding protein [Thalassospira sp. GB04J01]|tara:strand:- start:15967 stop:17211 length:1245 start_codon:yes stop_codon:yes gene_type:complete